MIPVFAPVIGDLEFDAVMNALKRGEISGSFGESIPAFEREFAGFCGSRFGVAMSSGTTALHAAVRAAGVGPGDEVLISASTNIATALAVVHNGAIPVPVDSEPETWNLDLDLLESLITPRTKAIIPVHLYGHPVDMHRLMEIANRHELIVIEDCAESHGATCRGKMTGSFGHMSCFSFYANKVITTGEGGMVMTDDPELAERLRLLRNLGFTTPRFKHDVAAFNFRMTGLQAAIGRAQLSRIDEIINAKRQLAHWYDELLTSTAGLQTPVELPWARSVYWMYAIVVGPEFGLGRDELVEALRANGIESRTFFCPMNQQPCLIELPGFQPLPCPVADRLWDQGLYLPSDPMLPRETVEHICATINGLANR